MILMILNLGFLDCWTVRFSGFAPEVTLTFFISPNWGHLVSPHSHVEMLSGSRSLVHSQFPVVGSAMLEPWQTWSSSGKFVMIPICDKPIDKPLITSWIYDDLDGYPIFGETDSKSEA